MLDYTAIGSYVLVVTLVALLVLILVWQKQRSGKVITVWFFSGLVGVLLGLGGTAAIGQLLGYEFARAREVVVLDPSDMEDEEEDEEGGGGMGGGMGMGMGMGGGMGGGGGGGGRFGGPPSPKRELTTLVRKLELLTGDVALTLSDDQAASILEALDQIETSDTMTDDDAQSKLDELMAVLDDTQKAKEASIRLARSPRGSGGGGSGGSGGEETVEDANPFQQEGNAKALNELRGRF